jgi:NAD(P)-dependent dehydrogenase (short-subunit alcohol dehydrogenase family)
MTTALVTGANQGLGLALARGLAERHDRVLLTGRDPTRVEAAAAGHPRLEPRTLDVRDPDAIAALAEELGAVDVVFSNAAARMAPERTPAQMIDAVVETNNLGTTRMLRAFLPILRPGGRLLVVASGFGTVGQLPAAVRPRVAAARTLDAVDAVVADWRAAVHAGRAVGDGWPEWINIPSKVAQVAAVRAVAAERRARDLADGTLVAAVCPGLVDTDASRPWFEDMSTAQTPAQAAAALLDLAFDPRLYGELVQFGRVLPWKPR